MTPVLGSLVVFHKMDLGLATLYLNGANRKDFREVFGGSSLDKIDIIEGKVSGAIVISINQIIRTNVLAHQNPG